MISGERFARHALVKGWDQARLREATVIVAGAGALGNHLVQGLALAGVGRITLCDPDVVSASNLSRAPLFRPGDVGRPKVTAAADAAREIAPSTVVDARCAPFARAVGLAEIREASLTIACLDSRASRLGVAGRAGLVRAAWLDGATAPWSGEVRSYLDPGGPCFGCALSPKERAVSDVPWSCMEERSEQHMGASVATSALVGSWLCTFALRALLGHPVPTGTLAIDAATGVTVRIETARAPECPYHVPIERARELALGPDPTVGALLDSLGSEGSPIAWQPILERLECRRGHFAREAWGEPRTEPCPVCTLPLRARTTLEIHRAPRDRTLASLGIPPGEILPVRGRDSLSHVELR